jgi:hypothetical protein
MGETYKILCWFFGFLRCFSAELAIFPAVKVKTY